MEDKYSKGDKTDRGDYKGNKIARNQNVINLELNDAIRNAQKEEKNIRKKRNKLRTKLEEELGRDSARFKQEIKLLKKNAQKEKEKLRKKNKKKVEHLERKYIHKKILEDKLPANLQRYANSKIFKKFRVQSQR